jgi:hypothetical protein
MNKIVLTMMTLVAFAAVSTGCEKSDYKHPLHRANGK